MAGQKLQLIWSLQSIVICAQSKEQTTTNNLFRYLFTKVTLRDKMSQDQVLIPPFLPLEVSKRNNRVVGVLFHVIVVLDNRKDSEVSQTFRPLGCSYGLFIMVRSFDERISLERYKSHFRKLFG